VRSQRSWVAGRGEKPEQAPRFSADVRLFLSARDLALRDLSNGINPT